MTRSRKSTPICGHTKAKSEKQDKRRCNRATRKRNHSKTIDDDTIFALEREVLNTYSMKKDGKQYCPNSKTVRRK